MKHMNASPIHTFKAYDPQREVAVEPEFEVTSSVGVDAAVEGARRCARALARTTGAQRAELLRAIASEIEGAGATLIERAGLETALPQARLEGERGRTLAQLRMFADLIEDGEIFSGPKLAALPDRSPLPRPALALHRRALGPVAVFGASNFPLAFSTAGGDSAAALAAGCPVVFRGHPAHPGTCAIVASAIARALAALDWPAEAFALIQGPSHELGARLVMHESIAAVAFTGSLAGGRALVDLAATRRSPIPVFAEMGSVNPVVVTPDALAARGPEIAAMLAGSIVQGVGQFCTKPGLIFVPEGPASAGFVDTLVAGVQAMGEGIMLTPAIAQNYQSGVAAILDQPGVTGIGGSDEPALVRGTRVKPALAMTTAPAIVEREQLLDEVFGPFALVVEYASLEQAHKALERLPGQLSATIHCQADAWASHAALVELLEERAGRVCFGGVPTGVEVCEAMHHGGPYPATSDARFSSVGTAAIERFVRPVCRQNWPGQ